ncbi:MAG TPA: cytochrome c oxidase subunit II [Bryobacteraceae bacterium]|jgi:cytochrome c oxidase subunit 2
MTWLTSSASSLVLGLVAAAPADIFTPHGTPARFIFGLSVFVLSITLAIFLVAGGTLLYVVIRYRQRPNEPHREPAQIYGSTQIELSWTVVPLLIVVILFLTTARVIFNTEFASKPANALDIVVIGHQYWWEFRYPKLGIVTANELHIPVGDQTPAYLEMSSADTVHSFWVPQLAGKMDVIPNRRNTMWLDAEAPGLFLGQCAQYCGTQHAKMLLRVYSQSAPDFDAWAAHQKQPAQSDPTTQAGEAVFLRNACINCHTISGTIANGRFGPDLTHLATRDTIASGAVPNTPENLRKWIDDPAQFKPGSLMPPMHLSPADLDAVTAYLVKLH